jgi:hypothetical protein
MEHEIESCLGNTGWQLLYLVRRKHGKTMKSVNLQSNKSRTKVGQKVEQKPRDLIFSLQICNDDDDHRFQLTERNCRIKSKRRSYDWSLLFWERFEPSEIVPVLPDFSWYKMPKREKNYQITTNYTKCP